ncbi:putative glycoside hydrolase [Haloferula sp.]|uniref:putative glycoside hydrolase n=1 Tax=Haloferula sp. TaxID=2497595 RepID=UPI0032A09EB5
MVVCSAKADRAGWPEFSWETVPVCLHFGKHGAALSDKELAFVARTSNLVCLEKGHAKGRLGSTEKGIAHDAKRLKALNPDVKVLYYWNGVLNYNLYEACKEVRKNPQWVLRDENGKPIFKDEKARLEQYNLLDPGFRRWWVAETGRAVREFGCDGVFMDALPQVKTRVLRQMGGGEKTEEKLVAAVEEMMTGAQKAMGKEGFLLYNGLRYLPRDKETGGKEFLPFGDGAMVEHFTAFGSRSKEAIVSDMESIVQAGRAGKMLVVKGWPDVDFNWMNGEKMREPYAELAKEAEEKMTFSLACFLVAAQEHSYFCYSWGYREVHGSLVDYGQFQKPLGKPKGDAVREGWTFRRSFENAEVWVDVEKRKATIKWGKK